jgi:hypothetical protein
MRKKKRRSRAGTRQGRGESFKNVFSRLDTHAVSRRIRKRRGAPGLWRLAFRSLHAINAAGISWRADGVVVEAQQRNCNSLPDRAPPLPVRCIGDLGSTSGTDDGVYYGLEGIVTGKELIHPHWGQIRRRVDCHFVGLKMNRVFGVVKIPTRDGFPLTSDEGEGVREVVVGVGFLRCWWGLSYGSGSPVMRESL